MHRIAVGMQIADGNSLHFPFFDEFTRCSTYCRFVKWLQLLTRRIHAARNAFAHALWYQGKPYVVFERIHLRTVAVVTAHLKDVFKPGIGQNTCDRSFVLKNGIKTKRRAVDK